MKFLIMFTLLYTTEAYKILCLLPYSGKSHHMVFEPLLQELTRRGHNLTVVSFFPSPTVQPNRRDVSLIGLAPLNVEVVDLKNFDSKYFGLERYIEHFPLVKDLAMGNLRVCETLLKSEVFEEFVKGRGEYDVIIVEHFNSDCMLGLIHNYGLPSVGLMSCAMLPWSFSRVGAPDNPSYVPGMTLPFTENMSYLERIENTLVLYYYKLWFEFVIRTEEQKTLEKTLGRKLPPLSEIGENASVVLVNTHFTLNGVRVLPPSVIEVGGIHLHNRSVRPLPEHLEKWVDGAKYGFILFSFGSLIRGSSLPLTRLDAILKVFARLPQRVLWKWETNDIKDVPGNVLAMKWIPQYDLLHHPNCVGFITHGGLLSLTEAVSAGVPTVIIPVLGDQFGNAAHAHKAGVSEVLRLTELDEDSLYEALQKVLSTEMRIRAKQLGEIWSDRPQSAMDTAVYHIERTARYKGLDMSSYARRLNCVQLALLDVIAFILALLGIIFFILNCFCRRPIKKEKEC